MATSNPSLSEEELKEIYNFALDLGRRAGKILTDGVDKRCGSASSRGEAQSSTEKMNAVDIVTQTDLDIEAFIHSAISSKYPEHAFIGEETYSAGSQKEYLVTDAPTWIIDPLDGTVNYTHLFPMFCISIAFCIASVPIIGVIHQPMLDTTFSSRPGYGAWQDDGHAFKSRRRLPYINSPALPLPSNAPKGLIFGCEWGKERSLSKEDGNFSRKIESFTNMARNWQEELPGRNGVKGGMAHGVRSLGSATLDLAFVATGAMDIWWEAGCWEWDVAAGIAILNEAGGLVTTANPPEDIEKAKVQDVNLGSRLYLAIRPAGDAEGETGRQAQERVVREVWKRVRGLDYVRPGA